MATAPTDKAPWQAQGEEKRESVREMFAEVAPRYDFLNGLMSLTLHKRWRSFAVRVLGLKDGDGALDVCCGTGDFIRPLRQAVGPKGRILGIDFCLPMLELAKNKTVSGGLALGDACRIPVRDGLVSAVSVGWGIRNVPDIDAAHREIFRVLKPGGRFVSVDMAIPENRLVRTISGWIGGRVLPSIGSLFGLKTAYTYLPKSTESFLDRRGLRDSMEKAGFRDVSWKNFMAGNICVHWGSKP